VKSLKFFDLKVQSGRAPTERKNFSDPNGVLLVKDLTITPPENLGAWTVIDNIKGTEYTLTGLSLKRHTR